MASAPKNSRGTQMPTFQSLLTWGPARPNSRPTWIKKPTRPLWLSRVGKIELRYHLRCLEDLYAMLKVHADWMPLGSADEQKATAEGTVEEWARSPKNPVGGWFSLKRGLRGRIAKYVPPVMKKLGLAEVEENPRNNCIRAR